MASPSARDADASDAASVRSRSASASACCWSVRIRSAESARSRSVSSAASPADPGGLLAGVGQRLLGRRQPLLRLRLKTAQFLGGLGAAGLDGLLGLLAQLPGGLLGVRPDRLGLLGGLGAQPLGLHLRVRSRVSSACRRRLVARSMASVRTFSLSAVAVCRSSSASALALASSSSADLAASSICATASRRASARIDSPLGDRVGAQLLGLAAQPAGLLLQLDRLGAVLPWCRPSPRP